MAALYEDVCHTCVETILSSGKRAGVHHLSKRGLDLTTSQSCIICTVLARDINACSGDPSLTEWPLYRWNLHKSTRLREGLDMMYLVLRAIVPDRPVESVVSLPDRRFNLYREQDVTFSSADTLGPSTNAPQAWIQVEHWLRACSEGKHPNCRQSPLTVQDLPTRLVDIGGINVDDRSGQIKLVETSGWAAAAPYITLSHSWGERPSFYKVTDDEKLSMMTKGIPLDQEGLSLNFQDAILATKRLKIRYMWIDFMCIIQCNDADFKREAMSMHKYYRNAYCNIGASASRSPCEGLFRDRGQHGLPLYGKVTPHTNTSLSYIFGNTTWLIVPADIWEAVLLQNPLYERAWVFQERVLAARMIHYAAQEIFFECATISACESFPNGIPLGSDQMAASSRQWRQWLHGLSLANNSVASNLVGESLDEFWQTVIRIYTRCQLSHAEDKITALAGVAKLLRRGFKEEFSKGLWSKRLEEQLAWRVVGCRRANGTSSRRLDNREPTWSWASMDGVIALQNSRLVEEREYRVCGHDGEPVRFEIGASDNAPALPRTFSDEVYSLPQTRKAASPCSEGKKQYADVIDIRGHLRKGTVIRLAGAGKWALRMPDMDMTTFTSFVKNHTVFPDMDDGTDSQDCSFMVIAYSKRRPIQDAEHDHQTEVPAKFHGIGLILQDMGDCYFQRFGSFTFINLSEGELYALIPHAGLCERDGVNRICDNGDRMHDGQPQTIFLV